MLIECFVITLIFVIAQFSIAFANNKVILENKDFRYVINDDGKNLHFIDKHEEVDYCDQSPNSSCASIKKDGKKFKPSSVSYDKNQLKLEFDDAGVNVIIQTIVENHHIFFEVISVEGEDIESLTFLNIPLTLKGKPDEPFAACALSLNIYTHVAQLPALQTKLWAACYERFGLVGAKAAIIGVPQSQILPTIKEILTNAEEIPHSNVGGPWAKDLPINYGSYLFNFGTLTEETVEDWSKMVKMLGFNQIDNHGGGSRFFRFGDFHLNREKWQEGWDSFKNINAKLHEAGIASIFHTYCFFIDKQSKYVTPIPHPQLGAFGSFTLAKPLSSDTTEIEVVESTADVSNITGFFVRNSVTLHIEDELITFSDVTKEPPYKFIGCKRGAYGTTAQEHSKDTKARHLKECFGLFVPDPEFELFEEIARRHAEIVDYADFDGIYFDAIDGSDILGGAENSWYYGTKFIFDMWKHLKKPVGMEMSSMSHHFWQFRSRWQAWDYPTRGHKRFIDIHANAVNGGLLLPLHLGWWNFQTWSPPQVEPTFPDVIEYLGCKLIGYNASISMTGAVDKNSLKNIPAYQKLVPILKQYESLRHANYFDESIKEKLRVPGKEFTLAQDENNQWYFRPVQYDKHKVERLENWTNQWQTNNPYNEQPIKLRIEALTSAGAYDSSENVTLTDFNNKNVWKKQASNGLHFELSPSSEKLKTGKVSGKFSANNSGQVAQKGAWVKACKKFEPWLDLSKNQALGVWLYGDGNGELINFRLESPKHLSYGAIADHYVIVDFNGWRYFELIETESSRHSDYNWPEGSALYHVYRESIRFENIESLSIWYNNLPPNKEIKCYISPVKALPMINITIKNPIVTVNDKSIMFPVEMKSGSYLEFYSMSDCKLYGPKGELLAEVKPEGEIPTLLNGTNEVVFSCDKITDANPRANVTVITSGDRLH